MDSSKNPVDYVCLSECADSQMPPNLKFKVSFDGELRRFESRCTATFDSLWSAATTRFQLEY